MAITNPFGDATAMGAMVAGIAVLCWVLLRRSHRYFGRRPKQQPTIVRTRRPGDAGRKDRPVTVPDDAARWEVRMYDLARELSAELDSKMSILQALIRDADRAAARLEAARAGIAQEPQPLGSAEDRREEVHTLADYGFAPADIASRLGVAVGEVERILRQRLGGTP